MKRNLSSVQMLACLLLVLAMCASLALVCCSGDDDDDDDDRSDDDDDDDDDDSGSVDDDDDSGDDDDDDSETVCGEDLDCYMDYLDCIRDCSDLDCILVQCPESYDDCLHPNGCMRPHQDCVDQCDPNDLGCRTECRQGLIDCLVEECGASRDCLNTCFNVFDACWVDCWPGVSCIKDCVLDLSECLVFCWPD